MHGAVAPHPAPYKGKLPLRSRRHVGVIAIGNAIGNSIVKGLSSERTLSAKEQAELDQKVAGVGRKELAKLDAKTRLQLQQSTDAIATDVGTRLASDGAAGFDALTDVLQQRNDAMMDQYRNKRAEAAAKNGGMWQQTKADIAAIDATVAANKQQRAVQAEATRQRYANKLADFRRDNPVYRTPEPAYNWDTLIENAKETRMRSLGTSLYIDRRVTAQEQYFQETGQLDKLYYSRAQKHDPVANVGLGVWGSLDQNIDVHGVAGGLYWKGVGALTTFNSKMALATGRLTDTLVSAVVKGGPNQNVGISLLNQVFNNDEIDQLNVKMANDVAKSHLQMITDDFKYDSQGIKGLLSERQITQYHHSVFKSYDASIRYYGGTLGIGDSQGPVSDVIRRGLGVFYLYPAGDR